MLTKLKTPKHPSLGWVHYDINSQNETYTAKKLNEPLLWTTKARNKRYILFKSIHVMFKNKLNYSFNDMFVW